jgi:hypothetical protein
MMNNRDTWTVSGFIHSYIKKSTQQMKIQLYLKNTFVSMWIQGAINIQCNAIVWQVKIGKKDRHWFV